MTAINLRKLSPKPFGLKGFARITDRTFPKSSPRQQPNARDVARRADFCFAALTDYIASPFGNLRLEGIHIGRFLIERAIIQGRKAAINLRECILAALGETGRRNALRKGTGYPEPLPMGTPARPLAKEIEDHLEDIRRRQLDPKTVLATERTLKLLFQTCGNISAYRVDYKHIQELWKLLRWAPRNLVSDPRRD